MDRCNARILNALSAFYGRLCARMPAFAADKLLPYIQGAQNISEFLSLKGTLQKDQAMEIGSRLKMLIQDIETMKDAAQKKPKEDTRKKYPKKEELTTEDREKLYQIIPEENFVNMEIIPTKEEIMSEEEPFLRPNLILGKYPSTLTYLDVQFRLLREDFLAPLREAVRDYLTNA